MKRAKKTKKPAQILETLVPEQVTDQYTKSRVKINKGMAHKILTLSKLGLTQAQMAMALDVSVSALERWLRTRKDCRKAYDKGRFIHNHSVQESLLKRALGYEYTEIKHRSGVDSIGRPYDYTDTTTKHVVADTTAMIFWLKNRDRENWSDVQQHQIQSKVDVNITNALNLDKLTDAERGLLETLARKKLQQGSGDKRD